jgi:hypothetical protein
MLFRVRLSVFDPHTNTTYYTLTHPVKVISKVTQLKKKEVASPPQLGVVPPVAKKRASISSVSGDVVTTSINRIEQTQAEQLRILTAIANKILMDPHTTTETILPMTLNNSVEYSTEITGLGHNLKDDMESSFRKFIHCFSQIAPEERKEKWVELLENISERSDADAAKAAEFIDCVEGSTSASSKRLKVLKADQPKTLH